MVFAIEGATNATFTATKSGNYKVQATVDDCTSEFSIELPLVVTGLEAVTPLVNLYPNPVTNDLTISFVGMEGRKQVTIYALTGESLVTNITESSSVTINVESLATGMYLAKILVDGTVETRKFKKQ